MSLLLDARKRAAEQKAAKDRFGGDNVPNEWKAVFKNFDYVKDVLCKVEDYIEIIEKSGLHYIFFPIGFIPLPI